MSAVAGAGPTIFEQPVSNAQIPAEGSKALSIICPFTDDATTFLVDLTLTQAQKYITKIQGFYFDNSLSSDPLTVVCSGTSMSVTLPPASQGFVPLLVAAPTKFNVASTGQQNVTLIFLNIPVPAIIWFPAGSGGGGGEVEVTNFPPFTFDGSDNLLVASATSDTFTPGQVPMSDVAAVIVPTGAASNVVTNVGPNIVYLGPTTGVTDADGYPLAVGSSFSFDDYTGAVCGVCGTGLTSIAGFAAFPS